MACAGPQKKRPPNAAASRRSEWAGLEVAAVLLAALGAVGGFPALAMVGLPALVVAVAHIPASECEGRREREHQDQGAGGESNFLQHVRILQTISCMPAF